MTVWLVAVAGNSGFADGRLVMRSFPGPAVYDVSDDASAQDWARTCGSRQIFLVESDQPPVLTSPPAGPLRTLRAWEPHLLLSPGARVLSTFADDRLVLPPPEPSAQDRDAPTLPFRHPCPSCDATFPSAPALARHRDFNHRGAASA